MCYFPCAVTVSPFQQDHKISQLEHFIQEFQYFACRQDHLVCKSFSSLIYQSIYTFFKAHSSLCYLAERYLAANKRQQYLFHHALFDVLLSFSLHVINSVFSWIFQNTKCEDMYPYQSWCKLFVTFQSFKRFSFLLIILLALNSSCYGSWRTKQWLRLSGNTSMLKVTSGRCSLEGKRCGERNFNYSFTHQPRPQYNSLYDSLLGKKWCCQISVITSRDQESRRHSGIVSFCHGSILK